MKQFREFKSQQQVVNEIGPVGATIATVMGIVGGAMALKKGLDKFKGYRESQREKKQNAKTGLVVDLKVFNPETGEIENRKQVVRGKDARVDNDGASKLEKKMQKDYGLKHQQNFHQQHKQKILLEKNLIKNHKKIKMM